MSRPPDEHAAIVLGHVDYGEDDRILHLLSPDLGRISALARRARRPSKRFGAALETANRVRLAMRPPRGDLWHLDGAELLDGRLHLRRDLDRLALAAYACELVGAFAHPGQAEPKLFGLLETALLLLDGTTVAPKGAFRVGLEAKALTFAGFAPRLDRCAVCGGDLGGTLVLSPAAGGAAHAPCATGDVVERDVLDGAERARRSPLAESLDVDLPPSLLSPLVRWQLGRELRSEAVLAQLG